MLLLRDENLQYTCIFLSFLNVVAFMDRHCWLFANIREDMLIFSFGVIDWASLGCFGLRYLIRRYFSCKYRRFLYGGFGLDAPFRSFQLQVGELILNPLSRPMLSSTLLYADFPL